MEHFRHKKEDSSDFETIWMTLEGIMLRYIRQGKQILHNIAFMWIQKKTELGETVE